uniref:C-type lectin domain family 4 member M-like n=1 Tax=Poecilia formosa TaxID=48698 RepID=A0A096MCD7_POEFO
FRDLLNLLISLKMFFILPQFGSLLGWNLSDYWGIYYISSAVATWGESRNDCLKRGADLVIINSRDEQDFLTWYKKRLWIGLTDAEKEGEWKWVDGTRLNTSYWGPDEPNSDLGENEDCGEMRFFESENNWNDVSCGIKNSWICERKLQVDNWLE